jgi:hypothetical protein
MVEALLNCFKLGKSAWADLLQRSTACTRRLANGAFRLFASLAYFGHVQFAPKANLRPARSLLGSNTINQRRIIARRP